MTARHGSGQEPEPHDAVAEAAARRRGEGFPPLRTNEHGTPIYDAMQRGEPAEPRGGRHGDDDGDGVVNQNDPDWGPVAPLLDSPDVADGIGVPFAQPIETPGALVVEEPGPDPNRAPIGPEDGEDEVYSRIGDGEPPRWPDPGQEALRELHRAAADVEPEFLVEAARPIYSPEGTSAPDAHARAGRMAVGPRGAAPGGMNADTLRAVMLGRISIELARAMLPHYVAALLAAGCTTVNRAAMFGAQVGHESASLRYMEEIASGQAYEGRADLGNTRPGDGRRFKGRGPIQLTGRHNYGLFGAWCHARGLVSYPGYFTDHPTEVATPRWGFLAAAWYWVVARPKINAACDRGDVVAVTKMINGGTNGLADRQARWSACLRLGAALLPGAVPSPAPPPAPRPRYLAEDPMTAIPLRVHDDGTFWESCMVEGREGSGVSAGAWVTVGATWGGAEFKVTFLRDGRVVGGSKDGKPSRLQSNDEVPFDVPGSARMVTVEGRVIPDEATVASIGQAAAIARCRPAAAAWHLGKTG